jgi:predicted transcriptional regulator
MHARLPDEKGVQDDLEQLVAAIRARGKGQTLPSPTPSAVAAVLAHLRDEEPMSIDELAERERQWRAVEEEMRAVEREDALRDRLL